ncbi:hypothetical protein JW960_11870 [candidate division KSB1 bacterium]|nr:hypothetical protein [candidate division KSB1 bacterium]
MKFYFQLLTTVLILLIITPSHAADYSGGFLIGYSGGTGFHLNGTISHFAPTLPLKMQLGVAYARMNPGKADDARKIFINDATNGEPEKSGKNWDFRLDFLYQIQVLGMSDAYLYGGPRYSKFTGNFKYIGGNEDFNITCNQWGWGIGTISYFPMNKTLDFVLTGGFDYYLSGILVGHDTQYSPDGENVNPRRDFDYGDADKAVNQPKYELRLMMGINWKFK